ncbi:MAG: KH domain-containing protein, partial [Acidobacteria bacterium]|nr:KH domain-containing protein [Acidobacteriota bacterium]
DDLGRVIGRQGRTATAIRTLVGVTAERDDQRVSVEFRDEHGQR